MHGSMPTRSISLIVKTFASSRPSSSRSPSSSERTPTSAMRPASTAGSVQPSCANAAPPRPSAAASTIPCTLPLGDDSRRVQVAVRVDPHDAARAVRRRHADERAERDRMVAAEHERQSRLRARAAATSFATPSHSSRICGRKRARSSPTSADSGTGACTLPTSSTATPSLSRDAASARRSGSPTAPCRRRGGPARDRAERR